MTPRLDFSDWWGKDARRGTPVVVTMENPNYSVVEIDGPDSAFRPVEKSRGKNAKQVTWVLLLKAHRAVGCVAWLATVLWALLGTIKKRLIFRQGVAMESEKTWKGKLLFRIIKVFLVTSLAILAFEVVAYFKGWHYFQNPNLHIPRTSDFQGLLHMVYVAWLTFRADYIAPVIQALSKFCVALFLIQSADRMVLSLGCFWIKYKKIKPRIDGDPFKLDDVEGSGYEYPMVLVQIPMCNEREVTTETLPFVIFPPFPTFYNRFGHMVLTLVWLCISKFFVAQNNLELNWKRKVQFNRASIISPKNKNSRMTFSLDWRKMHVRKGEKYNKIRISE